MKKIIFLAGLLLGGISLLSGQIESRAKAPVQPPYYCTFDSAQVIDNEWIVIDGDNDGRSWYYEWIGFFDPCDGNAKSGFAAVLWNQNGEENYDWMITASPVSLPAGKANISFYYGLAQPFYVERLKVFYSKTPDTAMAKLTELGTFEISVQAGWYFAHVDFDLAEAGDYYFSFLYQVPDDNQYGVMLDNIRIDKGKFVGTPDMRIERILLPTSSCSLGASEKIGVHLKNIGSADITRYAISYTINNGTPVREIFDDTLAEGASKTVYFAQEADFSIPGTDYEVRVDVEVLSQKGNPEEVTGNNTGKNNVSHFSPLGNLPFEADLRTEEGLHEVGYNPDFWKPVSDGYGLNAQEAKEPLVTRCMELEAGSRYRFIFDYRAGFNGFLIAPDVFYVLYGSPDRPISEWDTLKRFNVNTKNAFEHSEIVFVQEQPGTYSFAILPIATSFGYEGTIYIADIAIEKIFDHDIRIESVRSTLAAMIPVPHTLRPQFNVSLINRGEMQAEQARLTVSNGSVQVGVSEEKTLKTNDTVYYTFDGTLQRPALGKTTLTVTADMADADERPEDNTFEWSFTATDSLYAFDDISIEKYEDGVGMRGLILGNLFTLLETDTLTAVTIGWADLSGYNLNPVVRMDIFPVNESGLAETSIYSAEIRRPIEGGIHTMAISPRILPAGRYMIGLLQLSTDNMAVGYDRNPLGFFYGKSGNNRVQTLSGYGYLALRAIFGTTKETYNKDIEIVDINRPLERGIFAANEQIEVSYRNNGKDSVTVTFRCTVDDDIMTKVIRVPGYGQEGTVSFEADLSRTGRHVITVEAILDDDENPGNNMRTKTVECVVEDPYVMDFEYCNDFAITGLQPWRSVDVDMEMTATLRGYDWPNATEPQGFIAYNPYMTVPPINPLIEPYQGERFGAVFVCSNVQNNDWLISPKLKLPETNASMSFYTQGVSELKENYNVLVSNTTVGLNDFTQIGETYTAEAGWTQTVVDLSDYAGQEVFLAIQCVSNDALMFMIDDIRVSRPVSIETATPNTYLHAYPNPVTDLWTVTSYGEPILRVEVCDMTGKVVYRSANQLNRETWRLNVSGFNSGLYIVRIHTKSGVQSLKMVVQ